VRPDGLVEAALLEQLLERPESTATAGERTIVSVMAANNETGALQPIRELAVIAHAYGALIHCDAAQAAGKVPLEADGLDVDLLTVVGHKMYAPKGIAALYVRAGLERRLPGHVRLNGPVAERLPNTLNVSITDGSHTSSSRPCRPSPPPPGPPATADSTCHRRC
jgi:selenocysteine lyase/cysteine desulfurase